MVGPRMRLAIARRCLNLVESGGARQDLRLLLGRQYGRPPAVPTGSWPTRSGWSPGGYGPRWFGPTLADLEGKES